MNIVKLFATFLVVLVTGVAYAAPVCNHDADPTDPGRAHRDLSQNNLVSQRFISAGTEITMGYGKAGNKVTCLTKTQRLLVKTKDGVEYDAGCGNIIYSSPQVPAEPQTAPVAAVTPVQPAAPGCQDPNSCATVMETVVRHVTRVERVCVDQNNNQVPVDTSGNCVIQPVHVVVPTPPKLSPLCTNIMSTLGRSPTFTYNRGVRMVQSYSVSTQMWVSVPVDRVNEHLIRCGCPTI